MIMLDQIQRTQIYAIEDDNSPTSYDSPSEGCADGDDGGYDGGDVFRRGGDLIDVAPTSSPCDGGRFQQAKNQDQTFLF